MLLRPDERLSGEFLSNTQQDYVGDPFLTTFGDERDDAPVDERATGHSQQLFDRLTRRRNEGVPIGNQPRGVAGRRWFPWRSSHSE